MRVPAVRPYQQDSDLIAVYRLFFGAVHEVHGAGADAFIPDRTNLLSAAHRDEWLARHRQADARVRVMLSRGGCPSAVEMTASCFSALASDFRGLDESALQLVYAAAIIRFVNGVVDELQTGQYAESISSLAAKVGLPIWLVEVRHSATHQKLASLQVLREANEMALRWLLQRYWQPSLSELEEQGDLSAAEDGYGLKPAGTSGNPVTSAGSPGWSTRGAVVTLPLGMC